MPASTQSAPNLAALASLAGKKGLVVGIANEHSIAHGCARAMRQFGATLALTCLNDRARPYVLPLAEQLDADILLPLDVQQPGQWNGTWSGLSSTRTSADDLIGHPLPKHIRWMYLLLPVSLWIRHADSGR